MHRFYAPSKNISGGSLVINDKEQVGHISRVLHLKVHEEVSVFDDKNNDYLCLIKEITKGSVAMSIIKKRPGEVSGKLMIAIACAIPKNVKMDTIVDKLTQLGVDEIMPLVTERVIVKLDKDKEAKRVSRWRKIALAAAKQSQRSSQPRIDNILSLKEALDKCGGFELRLFGALTGERRPLKEALSGARPKNIFVLIGPEGDFTPREAELIREAGCTGVSLGELVLRVDTACIAALSFLRLYYQEKQL